MSRGVKNQSKINGLFRVEEFGGGRGPGGHVAPPALKASSFKYYIVLWIYIFFHLGQDIKCFRVRQTRRQRGGLDLQWRDERAERE